MVLLFRVVGLNPAFSKVLFCSVWVEGGEKVSWEKSASRNKQASHLSVSLWRYWWSLLEMWGSRTARAGRTSCSGSMSELGPRGAGLPASWMELCGFGRKGSGPPLLPTCGGPWTSLAQGELSPGGSASLMTR